MKKVCVTGALGFAGFHLCNELLEQGIEVIGIDEHDEKRALEQEEMELRIGRNALFHLFKTAIEDLEKDKWKDIDVCFHMTPLESTALEEEKRILNLLMNNLSHRCTFIYPIYTAINDQPKLFDIEAEIKPYMRLISAYQIVELPNLYGPWHCEGLLDVDESSLYIKDAVKGLVLAAKSTKKNEVIYLPTYYELNQKAIYQTENRSSAAIEKAEEIGYMPEVEIEAGVAKCKEHMKQWQKQLDLLKGSD
ncbi:NAD(P)-dependent oxidoreductase [Alkalihalophilus pseudofirmus]|uniref:NAD-dependent epimerase/dehydratase family protein n=1 Tax=Alkalihalophilus pseudofirmus TaxID=79885 RepID=UPI00259BD1B4|nr:NAD(P)-dependent oxidoreductase [Alkalihalophilus pseudofirmus]WEG15980.1 NAD(P)-dependent oxidoreductase [Alkalihalophilus pseudofirmus]